MSAVLGAAVLGFLAGVGVTVLGLVWWAAATEPYEPDLDADR